jgi:hypothetical protein
MPKASNISFGGPTRSDIDRRKKMAERLIEQGKQPTQTEMVSGWAVPQSPLAGLAKALQTGIGGYQERKASEMEQQKADAARQTMADALGAYTRSQDTTPTQLQSGETINWQPQSLDKSSQMMANMLMQNEDTAGMGMQAQMSNIDQQQRAARDMEQMKAQQAFQMQMFDKKAALDQQMTPYQAAQLEMARAEQARVGQLTPYQQAQIDLDKEKLQFQKDKVGSGGFEINPDTGQLEPVYSDKPMPAAALKMQDESVEALSAAQRIQNLSSSLLEKVTPDNTGKRKLDLGPVNNAAYAARNYAGASTPESVEFGVMKTDLEKLRNDTLRLNKGVQTEGDAQRAMNEVIQSINDPSLFAAAMTRLNEVNAQAEELQKLQIDDIRSNFRQSPYDYSRLGGKKPQDNFTPNMLNTPNFPTNVGPQGQGANPAITTPVDQIQPVLQDQGPTPEDIAFTAKKYGISEDEVRKRLGL